MPDPISLLGFAIEITKLSIECGRTLYEIYQGAQVIAESVKALGHEVDSLANIAEAVESVLRDPAVRAFEDEKLWATAGDPLKSCFTTLKEFDASLKGLRSNTDVRGWYKDTTRQVRLMLKDEEISKFRKALETHKSALNLVIGTINLYISANGTAVVLNTFGPKFDNVEKLLKNLQEQLRTTAIKSTEQDNHIVASSSKLITTARMVVDIMSETASTIGDRDADMNDLSSRHGGMQRSLARGEPITWTTDPELASRVGHWIPADFKSDSLSSDTLLNPDGDRQRINPAAEVNASIEMDSDDEFDLDLTQQYITLGSQSYSEGKFAEAESYFGKALPYTRLFQFLQEPLGEAALKIKLALSLFEQDKIKEAEELCEHIVGLKITSDADRAVVIEASFILAKVSLASGDLSKATTNCRQSMKARRRLHGPTSQPYLSAVALMQCICEVQGDTFGANACAKLLPGDFQPPIFKKSVADNVPSPTTLVSPGTEEPTQTSPTIQLELQRTTSSATAPSLQRSDISDSRGGTTEARYASIATKLSLLSTEENPKTISTDAISKAGGELQWLKLRNLTLENINTSIFKDFMFKDKPLKRKDLSESMSALHWAALGGYLEETKNLVKCGIDNAPGLYKWTPLYIASSGGQYDVVRFFLDNGASIEARNWSERTPLHAASQRGHDRVVRLLLKAGAHVVDFKDSSGWNPLLAAAEPGHYDVVRLLLENGASVDIEGPEKWTPLQKACSTGHERVVELLLKAGAAVEAKKFNGWTPLHLACSNGHKRVVELLLKAGADPRIKNNAGDTPLAVANLWNKKSTALILEQHMKRNGIAVSFREKRKKYLII